MLTIGYPIQLLSKEYKPEIFEIEETKDMHSFAYVPFAAGSR